MHHFIKILGVYCLIVYSFDLTNLQAQQLSPVAEYTFNDGMVRDESGNSTLKLYRGAGLYADDQRGLVLRFTSADKSYATLSGQLLNTDSCTFAFFFFWEDAGATVWHQLFETYNNQDGSALYLTPADGWNQKLALISNTRKYDDFQAIFTRSVPQNEWVHLAVSFADKRCKVYVNGALAGENLLMFPPELIQGDSLFLAGNPYRADNFYITARYDEINIFHEALAPNQIQALALENDIPEAEREQTSWEPSGEAVSVKIDLKDRKQTIRNFGSSDAWYMEAVGEYWPLEKKKKLAELLFSKEKNENGDPEGLGLSSWRFNIGAGTAEQGEASRIASPYRRTEGLLSGDGQSYNWSAQAGKQWFLNKAVKEYHVPHIIGWQNSPPVAYTRNNLGFREYDAPMSTILEYEHFDDFGVFLADVVEHFASKGIHFDYISPLNEPKYGWAPDAPGEDAKQEGSPWTNQEIYDVVSAIDEVFTQRNLDTRIFIPEAGKIGHLLRGSGHASNQLYTFWNDASNLSLLSKDAFTDIVAYHSYWNDYGTQLVTERQEIRNRVDSLSNQPEIWQTEYSLLGEGYRWNQPDGRKLTEMECALSLARVLVTDLNVAQTTAWQWWSTFGIGKHNGESRFDLIHIFHNQNQTDGLYHVNKLFYTYGNFSHFIRPGMHGVGLSRSDGLTDYEAVSDVMFSAFSNDSEDQLVFIAVNMTGEARSLVLSLEDSTTGKLENLEGYWTNKFENLVRQDRSFSPENSVVPAHSVLTLTADISKEGPNRIAVDSVRADRNYFKAYHDINQNAVIVSIDEGSDYKEIQLYSIKGIKLEHRTLKAGQLKMVIPVPGLTAGIYIISAHGARERNTQKVMIKP